MDKRVKFLFLLAMGAAALQLSACASIIQGTTQTVRIDSNVRGAQVSINGVVAGITPLSTQLKRASNTMVQVSSPGFETQMIMLATQTEPWFWGNILIGGFFGSTTDAASGAMYMYAPDSYMLPLRPQIAYPVSPNPAGPQPMVPNAPIPAPVTPLPAPQAPPPTTVPAPGK
jgi:hypothetical protein